MTQAEIAAQKSAGHGDVFKTRDLCYPTGLKVTHGETYQISLTVKKPWLDDTIPADLPNGVEKSTWAQLAGIPYKRLIWSNWFAPIIRVGSSGFEEQLPDFKADNEIAPDKNAGSDKSVRWTAMFVPRSDGEVFVYVNDTSIFLPWLFTYFYTNNHGSAIVSLRKTS